MRTRVYGKHLRTRTSRLESNPPLLNLGKCYDTGYNEAFYEQIRLQQLNGEREVGDGQDPYTYRDSSDGTEYEWDVEKKAWFPKLRGDEKEKPKEEQKLQTEQGEPKAKGEKRKPDPGWFNVEDQRNTNVYVTGLPPDITNEEFAEIMSKCGIIMRDPQSEDYKIKLYKDREGNLKGDGLCCYLKRESVDLALKLLDEYEIRGYKLHVENAKFQLKGEYDATKKKKKCKDFRKKMSIHQKCLDWRPEKKENDSSRMRFERVVIIKNMFHPKDFEQHPDGVASLAFKEAEESYIGIQALNGRWFGGRHGMGRKKSETDGTPSNIKQSLENMDNGSTSECNKENNVHRAENVQTDPDQDEAQSRDSSNGSSDEESEHNKGQSWCSWLHVF
ncbi:hypothetical protein XELAEV_18039022mg [Xenopus laevis]|uniref:RRM domain-containing protein n=1 Tax=Xenopus laevis TaxID=8355 RepID=A0A974C742_XENLA|nr:hypothetical protein XELAEV_18039022mg [Xenopus laevis]